MTEFPGPGQPLPSRPASVVHYRVGGHAYPMRTVANCQVCRSPYRMDIEEKLVLGSTYRTISEWLPEGFTIDPRNIGNHYRQKHMPLEVTQARAEVEARAERVGKSIEDSARSLVDGVTLLNAVVQRTFESIAQGHLQPDILDGIRATKLLADLGEFDDSSLTDQQAYVDAFAVYQEEALRIMGPDKFAEFGKELDRNPVLKALASRYGAESDDEDGLEVEVPSALREPAHQPVGYAGASPGEYPDAPRPEDLQMPPSPYEED